MPSKHKKIKNETSSEDIIEFKFAKQLAAIDKTARDKGVRILCKFLDAKEHLSYDDQLKLWKCLFYCFWLSDKPFVQEELALSLSQLIHHVKPNGLVFSKAFFETMEREWSRIDGLRVNKFLMLIRKYLYESFRYVKNHQWQVAHVTYLTAMITEGPLSDTYQQLGIKYHIVSIYLEELQRATGNNLPASTLTMFLEPFFIVLKQSSDEELVRRAKRVFVELVDSHQLTVDVKDIRSRLLSVGAGKDMLSRNRDTVYELVSLYESSVDDDVSSKE